jgi:hypothetical protein
MIYACFSVDVNQHFEFHLTMNADVSAPTVPPTSQAFINRVSLLDANDNPLAISSFDINEIT